MLASGEGAPGGAQRDVVHQLGVEGQAVHPAVRQGRAVPAQRARDGGVVLGAAALPSAPSLGLGGQGGAQVQLGEALLAEGVQALEQLGRPAPQVEAVVADAALVLLPAAGLGWGGARGGGDAGRLPFPFFLRHLRRLLFGPGHRLGRRRRAL